MPVVKGSRAEYELTTGVPFAFGKNSVLFDGVTLNKESVVIKVFRVAPSGDRGEPRTVQFLNELQTKSRLSHPNILPILDFGSNAWGDYGPFLVLPKCACSLREMMKSRDFVPLSLACEILSPIAAAIDYAHGMGVIHGDIKPENVLLGQDASAVYLADFGVAKYFPVQERISTAAEFSGQAGSSAYMSPEQIEHGLQSPKSDVYSLAVLAFELLTGVLPFNVSVTPFQQMKAKIAGELIDPQLLNSLITNSVRSVLNWGLRTEKTERPNSAGEFARALQDCLLPDFVPVSNIQQTTNEPPALRSSGKTRALFVNDGSNQRIVGMDHYPFTVGRRADRDLVIVDHRVSRDHAHFVCESDDIYIVDDGSRHGIFVNGERVSRRKVAPGDTINFVGSPDSPYILFESRPSFQGPPHSIFVSYSHRDVKWLLKLDTLLKPVIRDKTLGFWSDRDIQPGGRWKNAIQQSLKSARVAVLLVSPNFLASEFIAQNELPPLLEKARSGGTRILWIAVSASLYQSTPLAEYQAVNDPARPLDSLSLPVLNRELVRIAEVIRDSVEPDRVS